MKGDRIALAWLGLLLLLPGAPVRASEEGSWTEHFSMSGDFRGRYEGFWFDEDANGFERDDRHRLRYRLRLGARAEINPLIDLNMRLASGNEDDEGVNESTSRNQTIGSGNDFDPDELFIDQAYLAFHPLAGREMPMKLAKADLLFGKFANPWLSKKGKDYLVWDADITPEGVALSLGASPLDRLDLWLDTGYLIVDENGGQSSVGSSSPKSDPHVLPVQLRIEGRPADRISSGLNLSYYAWRSLGDPLTGEFIARAAARGAIPGGFTDDSGLDIGDLRAWFEFRGIEDWPILIYGNVVRNFSAENTSGLGAGKENTAWGVGGAIGDKKKWVELGAGYFRIEANAVPGQIADSDLHDGFTNREGWAIHGVRQIFKNTDLSFTLLLTEELDDELGSLDSGGAPIQNPSISNADRVRLQTNLVVKF